MSINVKRIAVVVITTLLNSQKQYVAGQSTRYDKKYIPHYTKDVEKATPFLTDEEANSYVGRIHNPFSRIYETEPAQVPESSLKPAHFTMEYEDFA